MIIAIYYTMADVVRCDREEVSWMLQMFCEAI